MAQLIPPRTPINLTRVREDSPRDRINFRLWQISLSAATILLTGWFWTLGPAAGLTASFIAKHVLVAILAVGLNLPHAGDRSKPV